MGENNKLHQAWLGVLGAIQGAEHRLAESLGLNPGAPLKDEIVSRMKKNRAEFERKIDEGVKAAVARVRAPIDKEMANLRARLERLQQRIDKRDHKRKQP